MDDLEKLYEFWEVSRVVIDRTGTNGVVSLEITFNSDQDAIVLKFDRPSEIENVPELIDIEHVVVSKKKGTGQEFGTIKVEFENLGDGWYEFWCDSVHEIKKT